MKRRKRRKGGLLKLAQMAGMEPIVLPESFPPPEPPREVIPVKATVIQPIDFDQVPGIGELSDDDRSCDNSLSGGIFSLFGLGDSRKMPSSFSHKVESEGQDFRDKRLFSYTEEGGKWKLAACWTAEGMGHVPSAIKMLGSLQGIFNHLFNMIVEHDIDHQRVEKSTDPKSSLPMLGFRKEQD